MNRGSTNNKPSPLQFANFVQDITELMQIHITDKDLTGCVIPDFTTTTENGKIVARIVFMGAMSKYFSSGGRTSCGLPFVTLLGKKSDWETILRKVDKISTLGEKAAKWHELLVPVLKPFVKTFEYPSTQETKDFWQNILHHHQGSAWMDLLIPQKHDPKCQERKAGEVLYMTTMIAGSVGIKFEASGAHADSYDSVTPVSGWFVYEKPGNTSCKKNNLEKYSSLGAKFVDPQDEREKAWMGMMEEERFTEIDAAV
ncbi:hypothetical protein B0J14DRAFT_681625 [Halenospora varia]|nr:hypothetical protein B0J14DRAFT_681625 [Halenospora varia]